MTWFWLNEVFGERSLQTHKLFRKIIFSTRGDGGTSKQFYRGPSSCPSPPPQPPICSTLALSSVSTCGKKGPSPAIFPKPSTTVSDLTTSAVCCRSVLRAGSQAPIDTPAHCYTGWEPFDWRGCIICFLGRANSGGAAIWPPQAEAHYWSSGST